MVTTFTPSSSSFPNSRDRIIASAGLVTCISSKHSSFASAAICSATGSIGSPSSRSRAVAQPRVGFEHEFVEVDAALGLDVDVREGEVHQHRLAAADAAPQIDAGRAAIAAEPNSRESNPPLAHARCKPIERRDGARLRRIGLQLVGGNQLIVGDPDGSVIATTVRSAGSPASACR